LSATAHEKLARALVLSLQISASDKLAPNTAVDVAASVGVNESATDARSWPWRC
jgi:hypothetical protein